MIFSIRGGNFNNCVSHIQSIVERKNTMAVLSNIKIEVDDSGNAVFMATDSDICASDSTNAQTEVAGNATVPALTLYDVTRKLPQNAKVKCTLQDNGIFRMQFDNSSFQIPSTDSSLFPKIEFANTGFKVNAHLVANVLAKTKYAISHDEVRYYLNGTYLHIAQHKGKRVLRAVALDGHRVAMVQSAIDDSVPDFPGIIIPKKAVIETLRIIEECKNDQMLLRISENDFAFSIDNVHFSSKVIDASFPDYEKSIPDVEDEIIDLSKKELLHSIDLISCVTNAKEKAIQIEVEGSTARIWATAVDDGLENGAKGQQSIDAQHNHKEKVAIVFNSRYITESLMSMDSNNARFLISKNKKAVILNSPDNEDELFVVMQLA